MENQHIPQIDPTHIPAEYQVPYDVIDLPSQGLLYPNKKSNVKVEYLTAFDETVLSSPNISSNGGIMDILIERKVKDLGFDSLDLLYSDRVAILLYLRTTAFGPEYTQLVYNEDTKKLEEGIIDLSKLKQKKLTVKPDENNLFDFTLPQCGKNVKCRFLTGRDEKDMDILDKNYMEKNKTDISNRLFFRMEKQVMSIDGETDKIRISNLLKNLSIMDSRKLRKYIGDIESGIDFQTEARMPGGASVSCFLRFNTSFFFPEL